MVTVFASRFAFRVTPPALVTVTVPIRLLMSPASSMPGSEAEGAYDGSTWSLALNSFVIVIVGSVEPDPPATLMWPLPGDPAVPPSGW